MNGNDIIFTVVAATLVILLLIAGVAIAFFIANKQRITQEVKIAQLLLDKEKELRKVQHEVQEQVMVNIGRELHDNIGQMLTYLNMQLEQQRYVNPASAQIFQGLGNIAKETYEEVRRLSKSLNSDVLENQGLLGTIDQEVSRMRQIDKYVVEWSYDGEPKLNKDQKVVVFRIFQEALNNIMKHSGAKNIKINMHSAPIFKFTVTDDGKGFNVSEMMASTKGAGLKNIVRRAELAKMTCKIDAENGKGATFTLEETLNN